MGQVNLDLGVVSSSPKLGIEIAKKSNLNKKGEEEKEEEEEEEGGRGEEGGGGGKGGSDRHDSQAYCFTGKQNLPQTASKLLLTFHCPELCQSATTTYEGCWENECLVSYTLNCAVSKEKWDWEWHWVSQTSKLLNLEFEPRHV